MAKISIIFAESLCTEAFENLFCKNLERKWSMKHSKNEQFLKQPQRLVSVQEVWETIFSAFAYEGRWPVLAFNARSSSSQCICFIIQFVLGCDWLFRIWISTSWVDNQACSPLQYYAVSCYLKLAYKLRFISLL